MRRRHGSASARRRVRLPRLSASSTGRSTPASPIPTFKARLNDLGGDPAPMAPIEFGKFIADETEKWGKVIKFANITPD